MIDKNGVILYLYDAKLTNPNGDPDEENRPRMDYERDINLVSDLRLKRYIRDYLMDIGYPLYVQKIDGMPVTAESRLSELSEKDDLVKAALDEFIDIRLFGATIPVKKDNHSITGPVQFNWGYSLHPVKLLESSITSHFASGEKKTMGSIGKDYRVQYSLIAFSGVISAKRAEYTGLSSVDINLLDKAMVNAIPLLSTRSKIGQQPRLYLRIELKDKETMLKDLRGYLEFRPKVENVRDISEYSLEVSKLINYLKDKKEKISKIIYFIDEDLNILNNGQDANLKDLLMIFDAEKLCQDVK